MAAHSKKVADEYERQLRLTWFNAYLDAVEKKPGLEEFVDGAMGREKSKRKSNKKEFNELEAYLQLLNFDDKMRKTGNVITDEELIRQINKSKDIIEEEAGE